MRLALPRRLVILLAVAAGATVVGAFLPVREWALAVAEAARALGPGAPLAFAAAYVAFGLLALPVSPLSFAAGLAFGPVAGALLAIPLTTLAGSAAFLGARRLGRSPGEGGLSLPAGLPDRDAFRLLVLLRLSPVMPFAIVNVGFGATRMRLRDFLAASILGSIPAVSTYAALGALVTAPDGATGRWLAAGGALLTAVAGVGCARLVAAARAGATRQAPAVER